MPGSPSRCRSPAPRGLTAFAWADADTDSTGRVQDQDGRRWDLLWMASRAYRAAERRGQTGAVVFTVHRCPRDTRLHPDDDPPPVHLVVQLGEDDGGDPVVAISLHEEN